MAGQYDRSAEDLGNIVALEHVNVQVEDPRTATLFYMSGLGLTRDPYMMTGIDNMWVNVGRSQFHLPTGKPQRLRGRTGLVIPDREALLRRLDGMRKPLADTEFSFAEHKGYIDTTCPWGNRIRCHEPSTAFAGVRLGMAYVEFDVPTGAAAGIADFYRRVFGTLSRVDKAGKGQAAHVSVGMGQELVFRETKAEPPPYDGHHIQVYIANFSGPHRQLLEHGLVTEESNQHQYRFADIVELESGRKLFEIEHEIRSMQHPLYARPLVNRNPLQNNRNYVPGRDDWVPESMGPGVAQEMDDPRTAMRQRRFEEVTGRGAAR
jgi:predicted enzyme related to lactoylglutathione lyase